MSRCWRCCVTTEFLLGVVGLECMCVLDQVKAKTLSLDQNALLANHTHILSSDHGIVQEFIVSLLVLQLVHLCTNPH